MKKMSGHIDGCKGTLKFSLFVFFIRQTNLRNIWPNLGQGQVVGQAIKTNRISEVKAK